MQIRRWFLGPPHPIPAKHACQGKNSEFLRVTSKDASCQKISMSIGSSRAALMWCVPGSLRSVVTGLVCYNNWDSQRSTGSNPTTGHISTEGQTTRVLRHSLSQKQHVLCTRSSLLSPISNLIITIESSRDHLLEDKKMGVQQWVVLNVWLIATKTTHDAVIFKQKMWSFHRLAGILWLYIISELC